MPNFDQDVRQRLSTAFKPIPEHLYEALVASIRTTLGSDWGIARVPQNAHARQIRERLKNVGGAHLVGNARQDHHGLHMDVWVDLAELDPADADLVAFQTLSALGSQDILLLCRSFEDDGIHYRYAIGTVDAGVVGSVRLIGPYARDVARLGRIGSGQANGYSA